MWRIVGRILRFRHIFIVTKKISNEVYFYCAYAWQPLVDELRTLKIR
jgi:hypothetical protein